MALEICKVMIYYRKNINVEYSIKWRAKNHPQKVLFNWSQIYNRRKAINEGIQLCTRDESLFAFRNTTIEWWNQLSRVLAERFANIRPQQCTSRELQQRHFKKQPKLTLFVQCFIYFVFLFDIRSKRENFFCTRETFSRNRCSEIISLWGEASDKHFRCLLLRPLAERLLISSWRSWFP